jgi:hypothetical protein
MPAAHDALLVMRPRSPRPVEPARARTTRCWAGGVGRGWTPGVLVWWCSASEEAWVSFCWPGGEDPAGHCFGLCLGFVVVAAEQPEVLWSVVVGVVLVVDSPVAGCTADAVFGGPLAYVLVAFAYVASEPVPVGG